MPCKRCGSDDTDLGIFDENGVMQDYCVKCGKEMLFGSSSEDELRGENERQRTRRDAEARYCRSQC